MQRRTMTGFANRIVRLPLSGWPVFCEDMPLRRGLL